ncbi:MAG: hypothetical protein SGI77_22745 [Pirellulaceae bacterium]|nr:hypothetical protein [Pirellulaceae bacterium]
MTNSTMSQMTFDWLESDAATPVPSTASLKVIPLGVAAPEQRPTRILESRIVPAVASKELRRGRPEHISDLLLVVLDRYGINPDEFLAGLQ